MCSCDWPGRLWAPPVDRIYITAVYELGSGWSLSAVHRHHREDVQDCCTDVYTYVGSEELLEVVDAVVATLLGDTTASTSYGVVSAGSPSGSAPPPQ